MTDYSKYGRMYELKCKRGKSAEFREICNRLYMADARIKYLALHDPNKEYDAATAERDSILEELKEVSTPIA